jgi:hypothetical protein
MDVSISTLPGTVDGMDVFTRRTPRFAAGRARALGIPTRGTTAPNRLRRVDRWLLATQAARLGATPHPLVVDLGFGDSPVTAVELYDRVRGVRPDVRVVGLELDDARVAAAADSARPPGLVFARGGFELAGLAPVVVRAMNVLRQYEESAVADAWSTMVSRLAPGGLLVEGTCDEIGRRCCWFAVEAGATLTVEAGATLTVEAGATLTVEAGATLTVEAGATLGVGGQTRPAVPASVRAPASRTTLTLSAHLPSLDRPSDLAARLPKALIARNVPGEDIHELLTALDACWDRAAALAPFGPRQRWAAAVASLVEGGWPVYGDRRRWRLGEVTVIWPPRRPAGAGPARRS